MKCNEANYFSISFPFQMVLRCIAMAIPWLMQCIALAIPCPLCRKASIDATGAASPPMSTVHHAHHWCHIAMNCNLRLCTFMGSSGGSQSCNRFIPESTLLSTLTPLYPPELDSVAHCKLHIALCTLHIAHCTLHIAHGGQQYVQYKAHVAVQGMYLSACICRGGLWKSTGS